LKGVLLTVKWLWVGLVAVVLAAGVYFSAPWKVTALLAVLVVTPTIVPKRARKYIYLVVVIIFFSLAVWVFLPEDDTGWRPYVLDEEIAAWRAKYAVPEDQNAAVIYEEMLGTYDGSRFAMPRLTEEQFNDPNVRQVFFDSFKAAQPANTFYPEFWTDELDDLTLFEPWSSAEYPELAAWLREKHSETIAALMEASRRPYCRFVMTFDMLDFPHDRPSAMRDWARLLMRKGNSFWGDERMEEAIKMYLAAVRTAALYLEHPANGVLGVGFTAHVLQPIGSLVVNAPLTNEQLDQLDESLAGFVLDWQSGWPVYLEQKKLETQNTLVGYLYEVNERQKTRFTRTDRNRVREMLIIDPSDDSHSHVGANIGSILCWFWMPRDPDMASLAFARAYEALEDPGFEWNENAHRSVKLNFDGFAESMVHVAHYCRLRDLFLRISTQKDGTRLLIAVRKYQNSTGSLPADLEELKEMVASEVLVDPINSGAYVYRLTGKTFTLYSKGKNGVDEGGVFDRESGADDIAIWPLPDYARKTRNKSETQETEAYED